MSKSDSTPPQPVDFSELQECGWAYRRRPLEGTVLYEAVRDNFAALLADVSTVGLTRRATPSLSFPVHPALRSA